MLVDVTGRIFQAGDDTCIALPVVDKATLRGEPRQVFCTEMLHWDDYRQERNINDGKPPMEQLFASGQKDAPMHIFTLGTDTIVSQVIGATAQQAGSPSQTYCAEMEHWDDYCAERNIKTGAPPMSDLFQPFETKELVLYDMVDHRLKMFVCNSVALRHYGAEKQTYCSEMEHWDDFVQAKTGQAPQPSMASLFRQP